MNRGRDFYRNAVTLALPIVLQNLCTTLLGLIDTFMVGSLGEAPLAAVLVANTPVFIIQLVIFGLQSGSSVLISQFWGKGDTDSINRVVGIGFYIAGAIAAVFAGAGEQVAFDIFRFGEDGRIAEHWDNLTALVGENPSGHTQIDGTLEITDLDRTEENRELVRNFLYDVMQGNHPEKTPDYFDADAYIQHNTGIADGVSGLSEALEAMAAQGIEMIYDQVHMVLAQGNYVLAVSEGTFGGAPTSYYDLWRVEDGKIAEHWDVMETIADESTWQNQNGKF